ncbi:MAG: hypothetical protein PUJ62_05420 [Lachnospiraceae bacterium]|nr:hypothetical protein [Lachnospiraceae bacterium]
MMKKKVMSVLLAAAMAVGMISGCGSTGGDSQSSTSGTETGQEGSASEGSEAEGDYYVDEDGNKYKKFDDVKLTMLVCWNGGFKTADDQYNNDVAKAIREKIGVTVEFEGIMMSEAEKLNMMFASGDMPDMVNAPYWGGTAGETAIIKKAGVEGRLIDIKDMVPNYPNIADAYDIGVISKKYLETDIDYSENNGARYVLPTEVAGDVEDIAQWAYGVFVRGDVADTLGIDPSTIKTSEELYDFMVKARDYGFKDVNGNDCIVATTYHEGWSYDDYAQNFNAKKLTTDYELDADGNVTLSKLTDNWVNKNLFIWKLVNEGILDKECFTQSDERGKEKVGNGTALFACAQYGVTIDATKQTGLYDSNPEMRYIPVGPLNYSDGSALTQIEAEGRSGSPVIFFPNTCSNVEAAMTWLDYVNSKEGMRLICYGFEGDTYELNEEGQPRMNADLTARYAADSEGVKEELRQRGINYMQGRTYVAKKNMAWFGESGPFEADAENEYLKAYKEQRPVEILKGYAIDAVAPNFEGYTDFAQWAFDDTKQKEYTQRAFFADTEEEAREILEDYQNYLRTNDGGKLQEFLDYMTEQSKTRDDFAF